MSLDVSQLRQFIVRPTLQKMQMGSDSAEVLITGTGLQESGFVYIKQKPNGRALSLWQIEPFTYTDLRNRLMTDYTKLADRAMSVLCMSVLPSDPDYLMGNLTAAVIFCRLKYYFDKQSLPLANDAPAMAAYYKRVYNTAQGAADELKVVNVFKSVIGGFEYHGN